MSLMVTQPAVEPMGRACADDSVSITTMGASSSSSSSSSSSTRAVGSLALMGACAS
jgi:hypothetical protein